MAFRGAFGSSSHESSEDSDVYSSDEDSYEGLGTRPYGGTPGGIATPEGNERRQCDPRVKAREDAIKNFYNADSDDETLSESEKRKYRNRKKRTPFKGPTTNREASRLLSLSEGNQEMSVDEFARRRPIICDERFRDLLARVPKKSPTKRHKVPGKLRL